LRWTDVLAIAKPAIVIAWHRRGFARFWAYKSRPRGRPPLAPEVIDLTERMTRENATWRTFLRTHLAGTIAIDFLTLPTVTFKVLYVFFVLSLERRRIFHVNVAAHPHARGPPSRSQRRSAPRS
jgi:hypothetical protein